MKIIEINIIQFGKLKDVSFNFEDGLNVIRGDNESGKSTILGFIKFALYGVGRKNPNVAVGERERALSWSGGIAAGRVVVEDVSGKRFRIERSGREGARGAFVDAVRIIDLESGADVYDNLAPGERFLGINAQGFDSMCNIKQLEASQIGADAVKGVIDNLLSSGDESTNVQAAVKMLDTERRRLLHKGGRGGLVFESESTLERLKSEHKGALLFENECMKNRDELERVELSLAKARDEHRMAQNLCDLHDDVLRLENFDRVRDIKTELAKLESELEALTKGADFDVSLASYERIAEIKSAHNDLSRSATAYSDAQKEQRDAELSLLSITLENSQGLAEIIAEHNSPRSAIAYLSAKKKKKSNAALMLAAFGVFGVVLLVLAAVLAFVQSNAAGGATVAFIAAILCAVAFASYKKYASASREIEEFISKLGEDFCAKDEDGILSALEGYQSTIGIKAQRSNALESAKFRLSMATDALTADKIRANSLLSILGIKDPADECASLSEIGEKMRIFIAKKQELDSEISEKRALLRSLSSELERFNEHDIRARLTPEVIKKISGVPFEKLKAERDSALQRTNQLNQYKAGIERNLASSTQRRSSSSIFPEIEAEAERFDSLKLRLDAIMLASETINNASLELKSDLTPKIRERAEKNLATATAGKYTELFIDENMGLSVFADGETRPIDALSKGSLDAAYFAVRLALLQSLLADKNPPLYMDELLSQLDDKRAKNVLAAVVQHAKTSQCLLFTCQHRDVKIAREVADFNLIELD